MLVLDFLIGNTDRHYNNFGLIRDIHTLTVTRASPIYDSGTSLFYNMPSHSIHLKQDTTAKPFRETQFKQIELVDLSDYDFSKLRGLEDNITAIYRDNPAFDQLEHPGERIQLLTDFIKTRQHMLEQQQSRVYQKHLYNRLSAFDHSMHVTHEEGDAETLYGNNDPTENK
ncbi:MAG: hypothetical protein Q4A55_06180 [Aerococcus sp.]|nr:hypothetical protein [Aerococcus sp.]